MRRDTYQDIGGESEKQRCCKQGHDDLHDDSILGGEFSYKNVYPDGMMEDGREMS
jgi:hypothetical protein